MPMHPVIKPIAYLLILINSFSCATAQKLENDNESLKEIIRLELDSLSKLARKEKVFLSSEYNNYAFEEFINELKFDEQNYKSHILTRQFSLERDEFYNLFNINQISNYKKQLNSDLKRDSVISSVDIEMFDYSKEKYDELNNNKNLKENFGKFIITLSQPVMTEDTKYGLIYYYHGNYRMDNGIGGISIYKKENDKWKIYKRLMLSIE